MNSAGQLEMFILTIVTGVCLGMLFDFYRILRGMVKPHWAITTIGDLAYWLLATGIVFGAMIIGTWGEMRMYVFLGLAGGVLLYYRLLSKKTLGLMAHFIRFIIKIVRIVKVFVEYVLIIPIRTIFRGITKPFRYIGSLIKAKQSSEENNIPPD